ncbi:hypothetical protein [Actinomadura opuntiae]|uniref:hypothetical protein n=1 Tax=Actinomadura sp. OS1-43 TaxID=604315 RepID=UPI00255AB3A3|nr:hypothetical protein [Actinomadura sp. OS1-43]MDL4815013.1 hypothetical protein [Actinomadura sp. OS1-43]
MRVRASVRFHHRERVCAAAGVVLVATALGVPGCDPGHDSYSAPCGVVVDGSASGQNFDADKRVTELLPGFLRANKCKTLTYVPLDTDSRGSVCSHKDLDLDPDLGAGTDKEAIRAGRQSRALKDAHAVLACLHAGRPKSDVLGALARAADQRPDGKGTYHVLVVSDMLQTDRTVDLTHADLSTAAKRRAILDGPFKGRVPDLGGTALEITDRGRTLKDTRQSVGLNAFWTQLFATAGHPTVKYD